jgi:glycosyltransferase involved in cell wall biosynthesis
MRPTKVKYEIIVIDDSSSDNSVSVINDFAAKNPDVDIRLIVNPSNRGISHNYSNAAFAGRGEYFCRIGGHFQDRRDALLPLVHHIGHADIVIGYLADDRRTFLRRALSRVFTRVVNALSGYNLRYYLGVVIFRRSLVLRWHSYRHQAFQADMITRVLDEGYSYVEVPIRAHQRPAGRSRAISIKNLLSATFCLADILGRRIFKRPTQPERRGTT